LNADGKVEGKLVPPPPSHYASSLNHTGKNLEMKLPNHEIQILVHTLHCHIFHRKEISIDTNIFTIDGHSLLLMQLYHQYKTTFHLETRSLLITDLIQYPIMVDHARLIYI
jgi:hypothetical protein